MLRRRMKARRRAESCHTDSILLTQNQEKVIMVEWKEYKVQDVCDKVVSGGTPLTSNKDYYYPATVPWLKTGEVNYSYIYKTENFISEKGLEKSSAKLIPVNSVIVAMYGQGDTAGRVAVNKIPLSTNQACCNLQINEKIAHYAFVYYYLWTQYQQLVLYKTGGAQPNLNVDKIKKLKILLPPLPTQQKIASILSAYDNLIQNYKKQIECLQTAASELYKEWFVRFRFPGWQNAKFENGIPVGWKIERIGNVGEVIGGGTPSTENEEYWDGEIPWLSPVDLSDNTNVYVSRGGKNITKLGLQKSSAKMMPKDTVLLSS